MEQTPDETLLQSTTSSRLHQSVATTPSSCKRMRTIVGVEKDREKDRGRKCYKDSKPLSWRRWGRLKQTSIASPLAWYRAFSLFWSAQRRLGLIREREESPVIANNLEVPRFVPKFFLIAQQPSSTVCSLLRLKLFHFTRW